MKTQRALSRVGWLKPHPGRFVPGQVTRYPWYRRPGGPEDRSRPVQKISFPPEFFIFVLVFCFILTSFSWLSSLLSYFHTVQHTKHRHPCPRRDFFKYPLVLCTLSLLVSLSWLSCIFSFCIYLQHTTQTSVHPARFDPAVPRSEWTQTLALDRSVFGIGGFDSRTFQPVAGRCTDWVILGQAY
jgi:hypothetical protein